MITATALLVLALGAPTGDAAPEESSVPALENRAETLVLQALQSVESRLAALEELRRRRDAGGRVSLTALRSTDQAAVVSSDALEREQARIDELEDEIRIAVATRRAAGAATPGMRVPEETPARDTTAPAVVEKTPTRTPGIVPAVIGEPEMRLADARYQAESWADALAIYEKAAADAGNTWARLRRARCLERLGRAIDAREAYESLVRDHPDDRWGQAAQWSLRVLTITDDDAREEEDAR